MSGSQAEVARLPSPILPVLLLCLFAGMCVWFAGLQDIWIDETTQLSGITLSPTEIVRWLAGSDPGRFGVPGDRMPPLSYLLDWLWWHGASTSIVSLRLLHASFVIAALGLIAQVERRHIGGRWAGLGLLFLALSPKTVQLAVEIRAYPLFFALSCVQVALFLRLASTPALPSRRVLGLFALVCVASCFVHFFGVVATFAYFGALLFRFVWQAPFRVAVFGLSTLPPMLALQPFVTGARVVSGAVMPAASSSALAYFPELFASSANMVVGALGILFLTACAVLSLGAFVGAVHRLTEQRQQPVDYLIVVASLGIAATLAAHLVIRSFDPLKPSYSIWMLPVLALIISNGANRASDSSVWAGHIKVLMSGALGLTATATIVIFIARGEWFVHGPSRQIAEVYLSERGSAPIIYVDEKTYQYGYFPMVYRSHGRASQWLMQNGMPTQLLKSGPGPAQSPSELLRFNKVIVVEIRPRRFSDLGACLDGHCPDFSPSKLSSNFADSGWRPSSYLRKFSYYDVLITQMNRL